MYINKSIIICLLYLTSCNSTQYAELQETSSTNIIVSTDIADIFQDKSSIVKTTSETSTTIISTSPAEIDDEMFLSVAPSLSYPHGNYALEGMLFDGSLDVPKEFSEIVNENDIENWYQNWFDKYNADIDIHGQEIWRANRTDLNDFANVYSFITYFNLSEEEIKTALLKHNLADDDEDYSIFSKHIYSDEEIEAISHKDKSTLTNLFAFNTTLVKKDKYYAPAWFFYHSINDFKSSGITIEDISYILDKCKELNVDIVNYYIHPYVFDVIEQKAYEYSKENFNNAALCGYDRDFSMPLAYDYFLSNHMGSYNYFHDTSVKENPYNILEGRTAYSPHWVYYNKPQAYKEAGIMPEELTAMLPKYKELGILSDEAMTALENKIENYK
ncbi:hypothetical protein FACS189499_07520 [Clostridia bacterium]|nr:hypothetical protein FACS189499_07520 [Clostridia bacterium]